MQGDLPPRPISRAAVSGQCSLGLVTALSVTGQGVPPADTVSSTASLGAHLQGATGWVALRYCAGLATSSRLTQVSGNHGLWPVVL